MLVIPNDDSFTIDIHFLLDRKTVILSLEGIPEEQLSQIIQAVYIHQETQKEEE